MCDDDITILQASLGWTLYELSKKSLQAESLPADWGLPLVWAFSALPVLPLLIGLLWFLIFGARGNIWIKVSSLVLVLFLVLCHLTNCIILYFSRSEGLLNQLPPGTPIIKYILEEIKQRSRVWLRLSQLKNIYFSNIIIIVENINISL